MSITHITLFILKLIPRRIYKEKHLKEAYGLEH